MTSSKSLKYTGNRIDLTERIKHMDRNPSANGIPVFSLPINDFGLEYQNLIL